MKKTLILLFSILSLASATAQDTITENDTCYMFWPHSLPVHEDSPGHNNGFFHSTIFWEHMPAPGTSIYGIALRGELVLDSTISVSLAVKETDSIYLYYDTVYLDSSVTYRYLRYAVQVSSSVQDVADSTEKCNEVYFHRPWQMSDTFYVVVRYGDNASSRNRRLGLYTAWGEPECPQSYGLVRNGESVPTVFYPYPITERARLCPWPGPGLQPPSPWGEEFPILEPNRTRCGKPRGLHLTGRGDTWVALSWFSGSGDAYRVSLEGPDTTIVVETADTVIQVNNLVPETFYTAEVRSLCRYQYHGYDSTFVNPGRTSIGFRTNTNGIDTPDDYPQIELYPNPATGQVTITADCESIVRATLLSIDGRELTTFTFQRSTTLDVSPFPPGPYHLRILTPLGPTTKKLLLQ